MNKKIIIKNLANKPILTIICNSFVMVKWYIYDVCIGGKSGVPPAKYFCIGG